MKVNSKKRIIAIAATLAVVAILSVCLVACNYSQEEYVKHLEDKDYTVHTLSATSLGVDESKIEWAIRGDKDWEKVTIVKFADSKDAKELGNALKKEAGDGYTVKISGSTVLAGTTKGVKDAQ